ncbi:2-C-methyl-D-erythritol 4-phosphate cytidylyltransferase [Thermosipho ferrireducens]|uniref:2-C-methyl-D-erythritol 4-phosphate cytidylyltransferase n=1 Tax=Thermosipho ferrireducens TaxID=2571116 RepID=A0ABX7S5X8_9BACT|nr:2-C-methyl-D-erythritol 4-phosphate cytidylyltransferase [Thermosipho ferrireducens]QTA37976.1 2-C-methyl-D-erythritol 4-phosphate cytidylyltransferase [Thermosipho ferrireducens]
MAIILFGGIGKRLGSKIPKQFLKIRDRYLMEYTIEKFYSLRTVDKVLVVSNKNWMKKTREILKDKNIEIIEGGNSREESTYKALKYISNFAESDDIILIHDGVRPFVSERIINENISLARKFGAVITVVPSENTMVISRDGRKLDAVPKRDLLYIVQTPQSFKFGLIYNAFKKEEKNLSYYTDDASILKAQGMEIYFVEGSKLNIKITTKEDLIIAEQLCSMQF